MTLLFRDEWHPDHAPVTARVVLDAAMDYYERGELEALSHKIAVLGAVVGKLIEALPADTQRKALAEHLYRWQEVADTDLIGDA